MTARSTRPRALSGLAALVAACGGDGLDRLPPDTLIDSGPRALTNEAHAIFRFHGAGGADHYTCQLDGAAEVACDSMVFEADLVDGDHAFAVVASRGGEVDPVPARVMWHVDTVPPHTVILAGPPGEVDSTTAMFRFGGSDDHSRPSALTFECSLDGTGSSDPLSLDGPSFAPCANPATFVVSDTGGVATHFLEVRAVDGAGNVDFAPVSWAWSVDTIAPDTQIFSGPADGSTTGETVAFAFSGNDSGDSFECSSDNQPFTFCVSSESFQFPQDGPHTFAVRAVNPFGVADPTPATRAWTVDVTQPSVELASTPANPSADPMPVFAFTSNDPDATFVCQVDGGIELVCTSPFTVGPLADGPHRFFVLARSVNELDIFSTTYAWVIDTSSS